MPLLGVNIDHVATIRNARGGREPDPISAAALAELGGADSITVHLREDRRHITDRDVRLLAETCPLPLNLEMAVAEEIVALAEQTVPQQATIVPEKREELTTEGGLDVVANRERVGEVVARLRERGVVVSLFIDPELPQIEAARDLGADAIELHTGTYAEVTDVASRHRELNALTEAAAVAAGWDMTVNAGHGLNYRNVRPVAQIAAMHELNIGHGIVSRAVFVGLERAVREMKAAIG